MLLDWFRPDPEFLRFKDNLPEHIKPQARAIWREMRRQDRAPKRISEAWLYRAVTESANLVEFRERFKDRYGDTFLDEVDKLYAERKVRYAKGLLGPRSSDSMKLKSPPTILARQKRILRLTATAMALMLVFPPFETRTRDGSHHWYGFLFSDSFGNVNVTLLFLQWLLVLFIGGIAWVMPYLERGKDRKED
jgi:hypothetical protein